MELLITLLIWLLVVGLIFWVIQTMLIPILPAPFGTIVQVIFVLIVILALVRFLLPLSGYPLLH